MAAKKAVKSAKSKSPKSKAKSKSTPAASSVVSRTTYGNNMREIRVRHSEMVSQIQMTKPFSLKKFSINPGLDNLFKWLAPIAAQYEQYHFEQLSFEYRGFCSAYTTGTLTIAVDYDVRDADPTSRQQMSQYSGAVSCAYRDERVTANCLGQDLAIRQKNGLFTRVGTYSDTDPRLYDLGNLYIGTEGATDADASSSAGDLWVHYTVRLMIPQVNDTTQSLTCAADSSMFGETIADLGGRVDQMIMDAIKGQLPGYVKNLTKGVLEMDSLEALHLDIAPPKLSPYVLDLAFVFEHEWQGTYDTDVVISVSAVTSSSNPTQILWLASDLGGFEEAPSYQTVASMSSKVLVDKTLSFSPSFGDVIVNTDAVVSKVRTTWGFPIPTAVGSYASVGTTNLRLMYDNDEPCPQWLTFVPGNPGITEVGIYMPVHFSVDIKAKAGDRIQLSVDLTNFVAATRNGSVIPYQVHCLPGYSSVPTCRFYPRYSGIADIASVVPDEVVLLKRHARKERFDRLVERHLAKSRLH